MAVSAAGARRIALWAVGILFGGLFGLVVVLLVAVLVGANIGPGRRLIEREAAALSGGMVAIDGLSGRFPDALAVRRVTLSDHLGAYGTLDGVRLDWHPLALTGMQVRVDLVSVDRMTVWRKPVADPNAKPSAPSKSGGSSVPNVGIDVSAIHIGALVLGKDVAGFAATLGVDGHARIAALKPLLSGLSVASLPDSDIALSLVRLDQPGRFSLATQVTPGRLGLDLRAHDPAGGLVAAASGMTMLDPLDLDLSLAGPRDASALRMSLKAGEATIGAQGLVDLSSRHFDVTLHGHAPAMQPKPGISWNDLLLDAHLLGTPSAPAGSGSLMLDQLAASGAAVGHLTATFSGAAADGEATGPAHLHAVAAGVRIPGKQPDLFASTPLTLDATLHNDQAGHPVDLTLFHELAQVTGRVFTKPSLHGTLGLTMPQLGPLSAAAGTPLEGHAALGSTFSLVNGITVLGLGGSFSITGGQKQALGLIGDAGQIGLSASVVPSSSGGRDLRLYALTLHGRALDLKASGSDLANTLDASFRLGLPDLQAASAGLRGTLSVDGNAQGPLDDLSAKVSALGDFGTSSIPRGPLRLALDAAHLPRAPEGHLTLDGTLDRATIAVAAGVERLASGATHITLDRFGWKSASGHGDMTLPAGSTLPLGTLDLRMTRLADLGRLTGQAISGTLSAVIRTAQADGAAHPSMRIDLGGAAATPKGGVGKLALNGSILDPAGSPDADLVLRADGIRGGGITGSSRITARGPQSALAVGMTGRFDHVAGAPATVDAALLLDVPGKHAAISRLAAVAKGEAIHLLAPVRIGFGSQVEVDHLRASVAPVTGGASPALIDVAGTISPALDLTASLSNITPALAKPFAPSLDAAGVIAAQARLTGTIAKPNGTVHLSAQSMRLLSGPGASLAPADLDARADLEGGIARIAARLNAGQPVAVTVAGTAPVTGDGGLDITTKGSIDLSVANAVLGAQGRETGGRLTFDMTATGTVKAPQLSGTVRLAGGKIQDFQQGALLTDINGLLTAHGSTISIDQLVAHAGDGTINASGTVGVFSPGLPVDLHITASKARPLSSDLLTAVLDADITASGQAASRLDVAGTVTIDSASINIPSSMPASVAQLDVIRPGETPPATSATGGSSTVALDMILSSPGQMFVRGKGLDAELAGKLHIGGTAAAPVMQGGFDMRHGTFSLAGVSLTFTNGRVGFDGAGVTNKIDPSLDFTAESFVGDTVAKLNIGGYADAPKITLSSTPPLPQDQVLALILFQQSTTQLSALQIASVAAALAELSGIGGGGPGILGSVRSTLGLDRLSVGSGGANTSGASVEAGKYVARGVYVGGKQSTSGAGTQAQVQIDLTKRLKLNTVVGTGGAVTGTTTPENDPGSSVGLKYQFQY